MGEQQDLVHNEINNHNNGLKKKKDHGHDNRLFNIHCANYYTNVFLNNNHRKLKIEFLFHGEKTTIPLYNLV